MVACLPAVDGDGGEEGGFVSRVCVLVNPKAAVGPKMDTQAMSHRESIGAEQIAIGGELNAYGWIALACLQVEYAPVEMLAQVADAVWSAGDAECRIT